MPTWRMGPSEGPWPPMVMTGAGAREGPGDQTQDRKFWKGFVHVMAELRLPAGFCTFSSLSTLYPSPWVSPCPPAAEE